MKKFCFETYQCWRRRRIQGRGSGRLAGRAGAQVPLPDLADLGFSRTLTLSRHLGRRGGTCQHDQNRKYTAEFHCVLLYGENGVRDCGGV